MQAVHSVSRHRNAQESVVLVSSGLPIEHERRIESDESQRDVYQLRYVDITLGILSYAELASHLALFSQWPERGVFVDQERCCGEL